MSFKDPNDAPQADHISAFKCATCEFLHVVLWNEDDLTIATAVIDRTMLENMMRVIDERPTLETTVQ